MKDRWSWSWKCIYDVDEWRYGLFGGTGREMRGLSDKRSMGLLMYIYI
jgi:hypothetical protein